MNRAEKGSQITSLRQELEKASTIVVICPVGLTVDESTDLRRKMRAAGAQIKVVKNTLAKIAVKDSGLSELSGFLKGPTAIAYSADPVAAAKVCATFANGNDKVKLVGGMLNGKLMDAAGVDALAKLPSLDELRARIVGVITAPATKIARLLKEPGAGLARVLQAKSSS